MLSSFWPDMLMCFTSFGTAGYFEELAWICAVNIVRKQTHSNKVGGFLFLNLQQLNECSKHVQNGALFVSMWWTCLLVGLYSLSTSPDMITRLSDFLFYNVPLSIQWDTSSEKTNAARNTGLPLQLLLHPPFHCLGCRTLAEQAGSSPHRGVMDLNHLFAHE